MSREEQHESADDEGRSPVAREPGPDKLQLTAVAAFIVAYAALSHFSTEAPNAKALAATLSLAPIVSIAAILVWRWTRLLIATLVTIGIGLVLYRYWSAIENHHDRVDLVEQCGVYGLVAAGFGRSLFGGRMPLCTQIAERLHGALGPVEIAYMRAATLAWSLFYALLAASILLVYFVVPLRVWSLSVNFGTFGLIALMALVDHAFRRRVLPARHRAGILSAVRQALIG